MGHKTLITGGAGFIGSHLANELLEHGFEVRVLDNLTPQVHGERASRPDYLHSDVNFIQGDVRDSEIVKKALQGVDSIFHFAAAVGVGQSMYEIEKYTQTNNIGTAVLLEALIQNPAQKLIVASSMSIYGEGLYQDRLGRLCNNRERSMEQLRQGQWEMTDDQGEPLTPLPTPESKTPALASVYALSKYDQERLCLIVGRAYSIPTVALRFFNVFGTRQALSNPYTGVLAIFASRLLNDNPPLIFEDGLQKRDFVSVHDIAQACRLALECEEANGEVFNVGSGKAYTVMDVAQLLARTLNREEFEFQITGQYRTGDIRHCFADISKAQRILGYQPRVHLENGLEELSQWLETQTAVDRVESAAAELAVRGLTV